MVKQLRTNKSLSIALDLYRSHYQNWLNIYQEDFIVVSAHRL